MKSCSVLFPHKKNQNVSVNTLHIHITASFRDGDGDMRSLFTMFQERW